MTRRPATGDEGDELLRDVLTSTRTWAVVGCSPDPARDSHGVAAYLQALGFRIVPVRPGVDEILGEPCHPDLATARAAAGPIDVVDVFRRADQAGAHVDEAIAIGAGTVWLQLGVVDEAAADRAAAAGLRVVMDRCPKIERPRLFGR
ncbi:MAG: CoA-binding domain protein [Acidimicrobiales bacterium]|nr:CoA-binding domain protein [Acidimicrobiales bacterium]